MKSQSIKTAITNQLYKIADDIDWIHLNINERKNYYERWTVDPEIGGKLRQIMPAGRVRVYIKDSIMGSYSRKRRPSIKEVLTSMSIKCESITKEFVKPQAVLCDNKDLYTLSVAKEWRIALLSAFERGVEKKVSGKNMVFFIEHTTRRFVDSSFKELIEAAGSRLGVAVRWLV